MEQFIKKAVVFIIALTFIIPVAALDVFAANEISITGGDAVKSGETFTVNVKFTGGTIGRINGQVTYDVNKISYISGGSSSGDTGYIQLKKAGTGEDLSFSLTFKAVDDGNTDINVSTNEIYDLSERELDAMYETKTVSISSDYESESTTQTEETVQSEMDDSSVISSSSLDSDNSDKESEIDTITVLAIVAAVVIILLVIVGILLRRSSKKRRRKR